MPYKPAVPETDRLGQIVAIIADLKPGYDVLEDSGGPMCGRHVTRIISTAEMVLESCYRNDPRALLREVLETVFLATVQGKDVIIEIERFLNDKLTKSCAQFLH